MNQYSRRRGWSRRRRGRTRNNLPLILSGAVLALILLAGGIFFFKNNGGLPTLLPASPSNAPGGQASETPEETEPLTEEQELHEYCWSEAKRLAAGYDYDGAIALLTGNEKFKDTKEAAAAAAEYEEIKSTLVRVDPSKVTHVFFHSLIMDTSKAFDGDRKQNGYNQMMTTKDELRRFSSLCMTVVSSLYGFMTLPMKPQTKMEIQYLKQGILCFRLENRPLSCPRMMCATMNIWTATALHHALL